MNLLYKMIYFLRRENVFSALAELNKLETISIDELIEYKKVKLESMIDYVTKANTYYCKHDVLNPVDKTTIKENISDLIENGVEVAWRSTSGTTGSPLIFPKDKKATAYMDAMMYLAYSWHGIKMGDKQARIWGRALSKKQKLVQIFKDGILRRKRLSAFEMDEINCFKYYHSLVKFRPKYFYAYANALYQFALFLEKNNLDGKMIGVSVSICTGEVLFSYQREKISEIFGCKVINEYGSTENGIIGFECEYGSMHVMPTVYLEINNTDNDGLGEIVLTELNSVSIPFVRYKNGDIGKMLSNKCKCNRPYEIMEIREGRMDDYIKCPDGRLVYDAILAYSLKEYATQFKAYQEKLDHLKILIIPNKDYNEESGLSIKKTLKKYLGNDVKVELNLVEKLPVDQSGKFRYFIPLK